MPCVLKQYLGYFLAIIAIAPSLTSCSHLQKEETAVEAAAPEGESLYGRLGGEKLIQTFSDQFVKQIALNNRIMSNPIIAGALSKNQDDHKKKLATLLCQITGGPCKYEGLAVKAVHAPLKITQDEWKEMTRVFIQVLQSLKVPKKERQALAGLVARYKSQIVGS